METKKLTLLCVIILICVAAVCGAYLITNPPQQETKITFLSNFSLYNGDNITAKLITEKGEPIANEQINITLVDSNGEKNTLNIQTNKEGIATFELDGMTAGNYVMDAIFGGSAKYKQTNTSTTIEVKEEIKQTDTSSTSERAVTIDGKLYYEVQYPYQGQMELALFRDDNGNYYVYGGDGLHTLEEWNS